MKNELTRRKFLKTSSLAAGAGLTASLWQSRAIAGGGAGLVEEPTLAAPAPGPANAATWNGRDTPEMVAAALKDIPAAPAGPFAESWNSIKQNYKDPDWFRDGKFGIMMHWGIYSVPAHQSEWYVRYMYGGNAGIVQWHTEHFGPPTKFGYKDFLPMYTAAKWDPDAWAALFKKAGAKYVLAPGEHHDGFSNWDSAINPYNAKNYGPKRWKRPASRPASPIIPASISPLFPLWPGAMNTTRSGRPSTASRTEATRPGSNSCTTGSQGELKPLTSTTLTSCGST
jgi:hypothetical protein